MTSKQMFSSIQSSVRKKFESDLKDAAERALEVARASTPQRTGSARSAWVMSKTNDLQYVIVNTDHPAKIRTLELRYWMMKRATFAADSLMAARGYGAIQVTPDFSPQW